MFVTIEGHEKLAMPAVSRGFIVSKRHLFTIALNLVVSCPLSTFHLVSKKECWSIPWAKPHI